MIFRNKQVIVENNKDYIKPSKTDKQSGLFHLGFSGFHKSSFTCQPCFLVKPSFRTGLF